MRTEPKVVLATTTFAKKVDELRFLMALHTCEEAIRCGYEIVVVDDSGEEMRRALQGRGATVFTQETPGMGASRRQAIGEALKAGADVVIWLEPEKYPIVPLFGPSIDMVANESFDIVVPWRRSLESYPAYQELSELRANRELGQITGRPELDLMIGPRVMSRRGAELLLEYTGQEGGDKWHILFLPILWALKNGYKVGSKEVDYIHPSEQTAAEEGDEEMNKKRDEQRRDLVGTMAGVAAKLGLPGLA